MSSFKKIIAGATGLLLVTTSVLPAETVVFDDDFSTGPTYSVGFFNATDPPPPNDNPFDQSFAETVILLTGGNPADYLSLSHSHDVVRNESGEVINGETFVQSFMRNQDVFYNPSKEGAFSSVTFTFDYMTTDPRFSSAFVALGEHLGRGTFGGFQTLVSDGTWQTYSAALTQSDAPTLDFAGNLDFEFGFGFTSNAVIIDNPFNFNVKVDNFKVSVVPVPEPGTLVGFALAGVALFCRRRRTTK